MAQETPPQTQVRDRTAFNSARQVPEARCYLPGRDGYSGLRAPDIGRGAAPRVRVAGGAACRLAGAVGRLAIDALRAKGPARGPGAALPDLPAGRRRPALRPVRRRNAPRTR